MSNLVNLIIFLFVLIMYLTGLNIIKCHYWYYICFLFCFFCPQLINTSWSDSCVLMHLQWCLSMPPLPSPRLVSWSSNRETMVGRIRHNIWFKRKRENGLHQYSMWFSFCFLLLPQVCRTWWPQVVFWAATLGVWCWRESCWVDTLSKSIAALLWSVTCSSTEVRRKR